MDFDGAISDYTLALSLDPNMAVAWYNRGTVHYRMGRFEEAEEDLQRAAGLQPDNGDFLEGLRECRHRAQVKPR